MNKILEIYFKNIHKFKLLTSKEEIELSNKIKDGDKKAFDKLVSHNLRFVVYVANKYTNQGIELTDLISAGNIGLMRAAKDYKGEKGLRFTSYAMWWIRQMILKTLSTQTRLIYLPFNKVEESILLQKKIKKFESKNHRLPDENEMMKISGLSRNKIILLYNYNIDPISLDETISFDNNEQNKIKFENLFATEPEDIFKDEYKQILKILTPIEKSIIIMYYGLENDDFFSLNDIAKKHNLSSERIRQIKIQALQKLYNFLQFHSKL
jgi:RNA polymerase primary sigma factor